MKELLIFSIAFTFSLVTLKGQDNTRVAKKDSSNEKMPNSFYVSANKDNFYGYYTYAVGTIGLRKNMGFTSFALLRGIQFGVGLTFLAAKGKYSISPFFSVLNGKALSGSSRILLGESFCPGFVSNFSSKKAYIDQGLLYYKAVRKKSNLNFDALLYWVTLAYKVSPRFYLGVHNESTLQTRSEVGNPIVYYFWVGAYTQINILDNAHFKFIGGWDAKSGDFARATFGFLFK